MYHYTYSIEVKNPTDARCRYIGVRSCSVRPDQDVYFGSCRPFKKWQAVNGTDGLVKTVLGWWPSREQALKHEILLHDIFDVARSQEYWNQAKQKVAGFDTSGIKYDQEYCNRISRQNLGHSYNKGVPKTDDHKKKISASLIGRKLSEQTKEKLKEARRKNTSAWNKGISPSQETKEKMRIARMKFIERTKA